MRRKREEKERRKNVMDVFFTESDLLFLHRFSPLFPPSSFSFLLLSSLILSSSLSSCIFSKLVPSYKLHVIHTKSCSVEIVIHPSIPISIDSRLTRLVIFLCSFSLSFCNSLLEEKSEREREREECPRF